MSTLIIDFAFALLSGSAGFAAAWYLFRNSKASVEATERSNLAELAIARLQDLTKKISADVTDHNTRVQEISDGLTDGSNVTADTLTKAVTALISVNENMQTQLLSAEKRLQDQAREIESHVAEARTDALTGLNNRRAFDVEMERGFTDYQRRGRPISFMIIDVDHFKSFNDTHGHQAGDEVLRSVARTLTKNSLAEHMVCRYGGEEFAIIFPGSTLAEAAAVAEGARAAIGEQVVEFDGKTLQVTASGGIAQLLPNESIDDLIRRADESLYASKEEGRDCAHGHDGDTFFPIAEILRQSTAKILAADSPKPAIPTTVAPAAGPIVELDEQPEPVMGARKIVEDRMLGLSDMTAFVDDLNRRLSEARRSGAVISVLVARIDNFEDIQSRFDAKSATMVQRAAAQFFKATMRDMDHLACDTDDSFSLLLPTAKLENALNVAERLRGAVYRCKLPLGGKPFQFTMSFGVAQAVREDSGETLMQRCKAAQCQAVQLGGNQCFADALELEPAC